MLLLLLVVVVFFVEIIYIPRALNTGTCIRQGDLFYSAGLHRNQVLATANTGKNQKRFWKKMQVNGPEAVSYTHLRAHET